MQKLTAIHTSANMRMLSRQVDLARSMRATGASNIGNGGDIGVTEVKKAHLEKENKSD